MTLRVSHVDLVSGIVFVLLLAQPFFFVDTWHNLPLINFGYVILASALLMRPDVAATTLASWSRRVFPFLVAMSVYLVAYLIFSLWKHEFPWVAIRHGVMLLKFILLGVAIEGLPKVRCGRIIAISLPTGILMLTASACFAFMYRGDDLGKTLLNGLSSVSDRQIVRFVVGGTVERFGAAHEGGATRNILGCCTVATILGTIVFWPSMKRTGLIQRSVASTGAVVALGILTVVLMSRSATLALICSIVFGGGIGWLRMTPLGRGQLLNRTALWLVLSLWTGLAVFALACTEHGDTVARNNILRLQRASEDVRWAHWEAVVRMIVKEPWIGVGPSALAPDGLAVHNFILGAWYQIGIVGLLVSIGVLIALLGSSLFAEARVTRRDYAGICFPVAGTFLLLPFFRRFVGGDCGRFTEVELIMIIFFFVAHRRNPMGTAGFHSEGLRFGIAAKPGNMIADNKRRIGTTL